MFRIFFVCGRKSVSSQELKTSYLSVLLLYDGTGVSTPKQRSSQKWRGYHSNAYAWANVHKTRPYNAKGEGQKPQSCTKAWKKLISQVTVLYTVIWKVSPTGLKETRMRRFRIRAPTFPHSRFPAENLVPTPFQQGNENRHLLAMYY